MWLVIAIIAAIAAAGAVVAVVLASGGSDSEEPAAAPPPPAATTEEPPATTEEPPATTEEPPATTEEPPVTTDETSILANITPTPIWRNCTLSDTPTEGATESAVCEKPADSTSSDYFPDRLELSVFPDADSLGAAYDAIKEANGIERDSGRCSGIAWTGEGAWSHSTTGKPAGHRLCYFDENGGSVIVWTHEKLDQPNHYDMLGIASIDSADHAGLFTWWRFWVHRYTGWVVPE
jgi:hypothetical protein